MFSTGWESTSGERNWLTGKNLEREFLLEETKSICNLHLQMIVIHTYVVTLLII